MFKLKKLSLVVVCISYIILTLVELFIYLNINSNIYGLIYLFISLFIIFLFVPVTYNYKRHYSKERISKIILIVIIGLFCSFFLNKIVINSISYADSSILMINRTYVIRCILKVVLYAYLIVLVLIDSSFIKQLKHK